MFSWWLERDVGNYGEAFVKVHATLRMQSMGTRLVFKVSSCFTWLMNWNGTLLQHLSSVIFYLNSNVYWMDVVSHIKLINMNFLNKNFKISIVILSTIQIICKSFRTNSHKFPKHSLVIFNCIIIIIICRGLYVCMYVPFEPPIA